MQFIKRTPGRLPEILASLSEHERITLLNRIRVLFYAAVISIFISGMPFLYISFTDQVSLSMSAAAFGIAVCFWLVSHLLLKHAKARLCGCEYAIHKSIAINDLHKACFSYRMLADTESKKPNKA
jgi:hypothetical protein